MNIDPNDVLTTKFFDYAKLMAKHSKMNEDTSITPDNVYQEAHKTNRNLLFESMKMGHLPGSSILGMENVLKLYQLAKEGKSCIILSEHVSNLDVPSLFLRFYDCELDIAKEIFDKFIFIAGVKLNENPIVKIFTEMFTRIVIVPPRTTKKMEGNEQFSKELDFAKKINLRSARKIMELRNKGNIFIMYPSGTRYRPWDPDSKKGIKETMGYLNYFDYFCCCSINGNNMPPKEHEDMTKEPFVKDVLVFNFGEIKSAKDYMSSILATNNINPDDKELVKQFTVDKIMEEIDVLHNEAEKYRIKFI
ncbi:MAG: 1-acyl-sn-glycerol-3-phosphate acyltransferase [Spirochaetes bacterium]|nr:1-acyl-sn-glycerol-3-phosphate acyltransferase [Spirochaetota bacterium]